MIIRILGVLILIAVILGGYFYIKNKEEAEKQKEFYRYAGVISEVSVAAELYRNDSDSFLIVRDSILRSYDLSMNDITGFRNRLKSEPRQWQRVWEYVDSITDSLVDWQYERLSKDPDSAAGWLVE